METAVIYKSVCERFDNRLDPRFCVLVEKHLPVIDELVAKFSTDALKDLCLRLPIDTDAGIIVFPNMNMFGTKFNKSILEMRLGRCNNPSIIAAYIAVVMSNLASKMLTEVYDLSEKKLAIIKQLTGFITEVSTGNTPLLAASVKGNKAEALEHLKASYE